MENRKPLFLFIHGAGGTSSKWRMQKKEIQAIYIDLPGHGKSKEPLKSTIKEYATWLVETIEDDVIVVGHSMGGLIGIELASISHKVKGLVFANSHYELPVHEKILKELANGVMPESFFYASYSKQVSQELLEKEKEERKSTPVSVMYTDLVACDQYKAGKEVVAKLKIPMLAVYGTEDRLIPKDAMDQLVVRNHEIAKEIIPHSGHYSMLEQPKRFNEVILKFRDKF